MKFCILYSPSRISRILTFCHRVSSSGIYPHPHTEFDRNRIIHGWYMKIKLFSKWRPFAILSVQKLPFWSRDMYLHMSLHLLPKFRFNRPIWGRDITKNFFFTYGVRPPSWISKISIFLTNTRPWNWNLYLLTKFYLLDSVRFTFWVEITLNCSLSVRFYSKSCLDMTLLSSFLYIVAAYSFIFFIFLKSLFFITFLHFLFLQFSLCCFMVASSMGVCSLSGNLK